MSASLPELDLQVGALGPPSQFGDFLLYTNTSPYTAVALVNMPNRSFLSLGALAILAAPILAQEANTTTPSNGTCITPRYDVNAPVNASATVPFNITSEPWYLTVSVNDTRTDTTAQTSVYGWLSTPANATSRACVYWLTNPLPAQSSGTPNGDCTGSLSENCVDFMRRSIVLGGSDDCPSLPSSEDFGKACGGSPLADGSGGVYPLPFFFSTFHHPATHTVTQFPHTQRRAANTLR